MRDPILHLRPQIEESPEPAMLLDMFAFAAERLCQAQDCHQTVTDHVPGPKSQTSRWDMIRELACIRGPVQRKHWLRSSRRTRRVLQATGSHCVWVSTAQI